MKLNKIFLVMLALILVSSIGIAVAEDVSVGGYTFTVPDGYNLVNTTDDLASMQLDEKNAISFATGVSDDIDAAKQNFLSQGKELIEEETLDFDGTEVNLQAFSTPGTDIKAYNYIVISDNGNFVITVATDNQDFDSSLESDDNPAKAILESLNAE